jgi:hypothetical protein
LTTTSIVIAGLDPAIHTSRHRPSVTTMDRRVKPGDDSEREIAKSQQTGDA